MVYNYSIFSSSFSTLLALLSIFSAVFLTLSITSLVSEIYLTSASKYCLPVLAAKNITAAASGTIIVTATSGDCAGTPDGSFSFTLSGKFDEDNLVASGTDSNGTSWSVQ